MNAENLQEKFIKNGLRLVDNKFNLNRQINELEKIYENL